MTGGVETIAAIEASGEPPLPAFSKMLETFKIKPLTVTESFKVYTSKEWLVSSLTVNIAQREAGRI